MRSYVAGGKGAASSEIGIGKERRGRGIEDRRRDCNATQQRKKAIPLHHSTSQHITANVHYRIFPLPQWGVNFINMGGVKMLGKQHKAEDVGEALLSLQRHIELRLVQIEETCVRYGLPGIQRFTLIARDPSNDRMLIVITNEDAEGVKAAASLAVDSGVGVKL